MQSSVLSSPWRTTTNDFKIGIDAEHCLASNSYTLEATRLEWNYESQAKPRTSIFLNDAVFRFRRYVLWFSFSTLRFEYLRDCLFSFGFDLPYNLVLSSFLSVCSGGFGFVTCFQGLTSILSGDCHVLAFFFWMFLLHSRLPVSIFCSSLEPTCARVGSLVAISNTTSSS